MKRSLLAAALLLAGALPASGAVLLTREEALAEAFPGAEIERVPRFLDEAQAQRVEDLAGSAPGSRLVVAYRASRDGRPAGTAYFDAHRVRTEPEVLMVAVDPQGRVLRVEVLSFLEPRQYLPPERWSAQFVGRRLSEDLRLRRGIHALAGATLSARAITAAVRRVLAIHQVLAAADRAAEEKDGTGHEEPKDGAAGDR